MLSCPQHPLSKLTSWPFLSLLLLSRLHKKILSSSFLNLDEIVPLISSIWLENWGDKGNWHFLFNLFTCSSLQTMEITVRHWLFQTIKKLPIILHFDELEIHSFSFLQHSFQLVIQLFAITTHREDLNQAFVSCFKACGGYNNIYCQWMGKPHDLITVKSTF